MVTEKARLKRGLELGGKPQLDAVVRESTVGDLIEARELSGGDEEQMGIFLVMGQTVSIGEIEGPFSLELFGKLTTADLELLQEAAEKADSRGRGIGSDQNPGD